MTNPEGIHLEHDQGIRDDRRRDKRDEPTAYIPTHALEALEGPQLTGPPGAEQTDLGSSEITAP
ncbi:hypothetical protein [Actinoplanes sp. NPDC051411]|uniref:hypothetical protein n=1 Tax=Actinoplanes sp. NPDC051411 TaxID=3155522 RepID=UPI0034182786